MRIGENMSRFMKNCAITALVFIVVGAVLAFIGGSVKGKEIVSQVVEDVTDGKVQVNLDGAEDWGVTIGQNVLGAVNKLEYNVNYDIDDEMIFDNEFELFKGDVKKDFPGAGISDLDVEVGGCNFAVQESADGEFHVSAENSKKFQCYVSDGTLHIKATTNTAVNGTNLCNIVLYVPSGSTFDKVQLEIGAGVMDLGSMAADKIEMEVGAGQITAEKLVADSMVASAGVGEIIIDALQVNKLDAEVGMGNLEATGVVAEKLKAECAMGNMDLKIQGSQEDYDYDIECGMGNIDIGDESFSGVVNERTIDNNSERKMEVECGMGNITIEFTE